MLGSITGSAAKGSKGSRGRGNAFGEVRQRDREGGQALVEFALIVPLFLMIVVGIIQFGVALNWWLDLQRIANQGARWVAVDCGQSAAFPGSDPCGADIEATLHDMVISRANDATVEVCWVEATGGPDMAKTGDPVRVTLKTQFAFLGITGFLSDDNGLLSMDINADATMRLEQTPTSPALVPGITECPAAP